MFFEVLPIRRGVRPKHHVYEVIAASSIPQRAVAWTSLRAPWCYRWGDLVEPELDPLVRDDRATVSDTRKGGKITLVVQLWHAPRGNRSILTVEGFGPPVSHDTGG